MLCNLVENGHEKCSDYWSSQSNEKIKGIDQYLSVSKLRVKGPSEEEEDDFSCIRIHYSEW